MNDQPRYDDADSVAWSMLLDKEMMAYPGSIPVGVDTAPEPIEPALTSTGRHVYVSAMLRNDRTVKGLLCFRDGGRIVLAHDEPSTFVTFHTDDAFSVAVAYVDPLTSAQGNSDE